MRTLVVFILVAGLAMLVAASLGQEQLRTTATAALFAFLGVSIYLAFGWSSRASQNDPESPIVVAKRHDEMQAAVVVDQLQAHDINAVAVGTFTSGFQVEIASMVKIVVPRRQVEQARQILDAPNDDA